MRLRFIPEAKPYIETSNYVVSSPFSQKSHWKKSFSNNMPLYLEIGCGKGDFLITNASLFPNRYFIGMEMYESVLFKALKKIENSNYSNLLFLNNNASELTEIFEEDEIDHIYLNFSDPWPKKRHANRRLTSFVFIEKYAKILKKGGLIEFKTDNNALFEYSLDTFGETPLFDIIDSTRNLYSTPHLLEGNIPTEYEKKFVAKGLPINKLIVQLK